MLQQNGNEFASIPIGHSVQMKESHDTIKQVLEKVKYQSITGKSGDLKIVCILIG